MTAAITLVLALNLWNSSSFGGEIMHRCHVGAEIVHLSAACALPVTQRTEADDCTATLNMIPAKSDHGDAARCVDCMADCLSGVRRLDCNCAGLKGEGK